MASALRAISPWLPALTVVAAVGGATVGGVFFGFSAFVMPALTRLPAPQGIAAMQSINVTVLSPAFMTVYLGTGLCCAVLGIRAVLAWGERPAALLLAGAALYLVGVILLTGAFHVPRNNALTALDPAGPAAAEQWATFVRAWSWGNHVRVAAGLGTAVALILALAS